MGGQYWQDITSSSDGDRLVAIVQSGDIWTSSDSGVSWTNVTTGIPSLSGLGWKSITSSSDGSKLAVIDSNNGDIFTSSDSGTTWTNVTTGNASMSGQNWTSITSSSDGNKLAAAVNRSGVWISNNGGISWTKTNLANGS